MATTSEIIRFCAYGVPQPQGSKSAYVPLDKQGDPYRRPNGGVIVQTVDKNTKAKPWMTAVRNAATAAYRGELLTGPVRVTVRYFFVRPAKHFGTGRNRNQLKSWAPELYAVETPDLDKLDRAIGDALTDTILRDDKQICQRGCQHGKYWTTEQPRAVIEIMLLETPSDNREEIA